MHSPLDYVCDHIVNALRYQRVGLAREAGASWVMAEAWMRQVERGLGR